jgi:hypothetical protein
MSVSYINPTYNSIAITVTNIPCEAIDYHDITNDGRYKCTVSIGGKGYGYLIQSIKDFIESSTSDKYTVSIEGIKWHMFDQLDEFLYLSGNELYKKPCIQHGKLNSTTGETKEVSSQITIRGDIDVTVGVHFRERLNTIEISGFIILAIDKASNSNFKYVGDPVFPDWLLDNADRDEHNITIEDLDEFMKTF